MKKIVLFHVLLFLSGICWTQTKNFIDQPYLETSARVDTLVTPDRIYLKITLQESDTKGRTSLEKLEQRMGNQLKGLGIDLDKQLTVSDLSSDFGKYFLRKQEVLKEKTFTLLLYDAPTAGRVLYELEEIGISNVRLQRTEYAQMDTLKDTLKARAVQRARQQGRIMTQALGQSLGKALFISDSGFSIFNSLEDRGERVMMAADGSESTYVALPVDFDKIRAEARVQVRFVLE